MKLNQRYNEISKWIDKEAAFDQLAELFYDRNFSAASKGEIELLMFSIYMEAVIKEESDENGVLNYPGASDYEIGKELGITEARVRNLKMKKQARYPVQFDWKESVYSLIDFIRYENNKIIIPTPDPNLASEIKNFIRKNGGYIEFDSGVDFIRIRVEYFLLLMYYTLDETDKEKFHKEMKKRLKEKNKHEDDYEYVDKRELVTDMMSMAGQAIDLASSIVEIVSPTNTLAKIIRNVIKGAMG